MKSWRALVALLVSLAFHGLLALILLWSGVFSSDCEVLAELDLSSVELSFSEKDVEAPPVQQAITSVSEFETVSPQGEEPPPDIVPEKRLPPDPAAVSLREPNLPIARMEAVESAPDQARIDAPPRPLRTIRPEYPKGARRRGEEGLVVLEVEVGSAGACAAVRVVTSCGHAELDEAACRAAQQAKFVPAKSAGRAVASTVRLAIAFRLKNVF